MSGRFCSALLIFVLVAIACIPAFPADAAVFRVDSGSTAPTPDGQSWATAYPSIQQAIDAAATAGASEAEPAEVWVVAGTYTANTDPVVTMQPWVSLYGGFAGTETSRSQRDRYTNFVTLDGEDTRRCVVGADDAVLDGFTITKGCTTLEGGGGMYRGTARNCVFSANMVFGDGGCGGGMYDGAAIQCRFVGNAVSGNTRCYGGGMYEGTATSCIFIGNVVSTRYWGGGGGMAEGAATNCTFTDNAADMGGGMYNGIAMNCTITANTGGMCGGSATNCIIWGNSWNEVEDVTVSYSCSSTYLEGTGNIRDNPRFLNPWEGDFRLRRFSPCIDRGTAVASPERDLWGRARPQGAGIDMGAFEYCPGDGAGAFPQPTAVRVNPNSTAANPDGLTWTTAYRTLQEAAAHAGYGTEIWVTQGVYTADSGEEVVKLLPETGICGGFNGTEISRDERNPNSNVTVIDGGGVRRCITANPLSYVDGLTLRNGSADSGGGMLDGTATNCAFAQNTAEFGGGMIDGTAEGCTFTGNTATHSGGGLYWGTAADCTFTENTASEDGGGMCVGTAEHCTFTRNTASLNGGGMYGGYGRTDIEDGEATNCIFVENTASSNGGGLCTGDARNCTFIKNRALGYGGGMYQGDALNCTLIMNTAALHGGGGIYQGTADECIIWGNSPTETERVSVSRSCLSSVVEGSGNIVGNPRFVNPWAGDFRLRHDSPCVDTCGPWGYYRDQLGRKRPEGAGADMGAFEHYADDDAAAPEQPEAIRVNETSMASNPDGLTWATAYRTLQEAAGHAGYGTEIWVAQGVYEADSGEQVAILLPGTDMYGGFIGTENARDERSLDNNIVVIDGGEARRCVTGNPVTSVTSLTLRGGHAEYGGGFCFGTATNCLFTGNYACRGGGMCGGNAIDSTFNGNTANSGGGADDVTAANCTFSGNTAQLGGGMSSKTAFNCTFTENTASSLGGGMDNGTATNCTFRGNESHYGGGIHNGTAACSAFSENTADYGGAMLGGRATNCTFAGNTASQFGGGTSGTRATNCTYAGNVAGVGGGMYDGTAVNCILWGNSGGEANSVAKITYSCVTGGHTGDGNIDQNPRFVSVSRGDLRLRPTSPCIDAGTTEGTPDTDITGVARPQGIGVDMGAYEMEASATAPNVVGLSQSVAATTIADAGLIVGAVTAEYSDSTAEGLVISQTPTAGTAVVPRSFLALVISLGVAPPDVNDDGTTDAMDVQMTINAALGNPVPADCDIDHDGDVDAVDIQLAINAVLGL